MNDVDHEVDEENMDGAILMDVVNVSMVDGMMEGGG